MASQQRPPSRPWSRLITMARPPPAAPTPPPPEPAPAPPRPTLMRPTFRAPPAAPPPLPAPSVAAPPPPPPATVVPPPPPPVTNVMAPQPPATVVATPSSSPRVSQPSMPSAPRTPPLPQSTPPLAVSASPPLPTAAMGTATIRAISSPPKFVKPVEKTPPPSPTIKPISRPPSPLTLPFPQLRSNNGSQPEYEQKAVLVQETKEKPNRSNVDLGRHIGWSTHDPKQDESKKTEPSKKHSDSEEFGTRSITIAGENKGAVMELGRFRNKKPEFGNKPHSIHIKKASEGEKSGTDSEGKSKAKNKNQKSNPQPTTAVMNSNVQGVNNSILYNCSTNHHDPGVHFSLSRKPIIGRGFHFKDHKDNQN